ncbi:SIS domain-containing protein [archaeon]|nr:SIS domain-containing protein [archaeon]
MDDRILGIISESSDLHAKLGDIVPQIRQAAGIMTAALRIGNKIMFAGNGGSAADAQHLAAELVNRFLKERRPLAGLALTTDTSVLTSVGNDYTFDEIFSKQVLALGREGDILLGISTSGNSRNILAAFDVSRKIGVKTVSLTGSAGVMKERADHAVVVPSTKTPRIQEAQILIGHILCEIIEDELSGGI